MTQIHQEITVELKSILTQRIRQEISMLVFRRYMNGRNITAKNELFQMMVTHVDMHRIRARYGVLCHLYCTLVVLKNFHALFAASRQTKTPKLNVPHKKSLLGALRHRHVFGLRGGKRNAFLRPRKPAYCCASALHYSTRR